MAIQYSCVLDKEYGENCVDRGRRVDQSVKKKKKKMGKTRIPLGKGLKA